MLNCFGVHWHWSYFVWGYGVDSSEVFSLYHFRINLCCLLQFVIRKFVMFVKCNHCEFTRLLYLTGIWTYVKTPVASFYLSVNIGIDFGGLGAQTTPKVFSVGTAPPEKIAFSSIIFLLLYPLDFPLRNRNFTQLSQFKS